MGGFRVGRLLALVVGALATAGGIEPAGSQPLDRLDGDIEAVLARTQTPGAAVAVVRGDRVAWARGLGVASVELGTPVTPETLFQTGSLTKPFTAAAVLVAAARGQLGLDEPIGRYVKGLAPALSRLTLTHLLSHTAGLKDEPDEYGPHDERALAEYARSWTDAYCLLPPGRAFSYSNSGFALAGLVLQEALGRPYADLVDELVFTPLGMRRSFFRPTMAMTYPMAMGHRVKEGRVEVVRPMPDDARLWPAGAFYTNVSDLARFAIALLNDGVVDGREALPASVIRQMLAPHADVPALGQRYGYGLFLYSDRGHARIEHGGTMPGFTAALEAVPDARTAVVILANRDPVRLDEIAALVIDALVFDGKAAESAPAAPAAGQPMSAAEQARYVGRFTNPERWTLEIAQVPAGLVLRQFGREFRLVKEEDGRLATRPPAGSPQRLVVLPGADGRAEIVQFAVWSFVRVAEGTP